MRNIRNLSRIRTIIRHSGFSIKNVPSVDFPIPVTVFYRNAHDGTVGGFWPKGNWRTAFPAINQNGTPAWKWNLAVYNLFSALGFEGFIAHGKLVVYTDLPTATSLQHQWQRSIN